MSSHSLLWGGLAALGAGVFLTLLYAAATEGVSPSGPLLLISLICPLLVGTGAVMLIAGAVMRALGR